MCDRCEKLEAVASAVKVWDEAIKTADGFWRTFNQARRGYAARPDRNISDISEHLLPHLTRAQTADDAVEKAKSVLRELISST